MRTAVATVAETRRLEAEQIETWGVPELVLMERAALGVAHQVRALCAPGTAIAVVAGTGNNGADGLAAARLLKGWGHDPVVYGLEGKGTASHARQLDWARRWGVRLESFAAGTCLPDNAVLVDALFGCGLNREPTGLAAQAIQAIETARARAVVAVDLPSGLDGTTGAAMGPVVTATHTVAAGVLKSGLLMDPALAMVGRLVLADIGLAPCLLDQLPGEVLVPQALPPRELAAHKGTAGSLLIVGGSAAMSGAPALAARAAARVGAGLVYLAVPEGIRDAVAVQVPEAVVYGLPMAVDGGLAAGAWEPLAALLERCQAGILGPGLSRGAEALGLAERLYRTWDRPLVVDADALQPELLALGAPGPRLLTPHPGEAARLLGSTSRQVQADRLEHARAIADRAGAIAILKGARTLVAEPGGTYGVNVLGTPAMATAGSGDVLAGVLGGLLAQGLAPVAAARQGVAWHGLAGLHAADGRHALIASDLVASLPSAMGPAARSRRAESDLQPIGELPPERGWDGTRPRK